jgi:hypothetical protein
LDWESNWTLRIVTTKAQQANEIETRVLKHFSGINPEMQMAAISLLMDWEKRFPAVLPEPKTNLRLVHTR